MEKDLIEIRDYNSKELPFFEFSRPRLINGEMQLLGKNEKAQEENTMAEMKIRHTETAGDYSSETVFEGKDLEFIHEDLLKTLFGAKNVSPAPEGKKEVKLASVETKQPGVEGNVVAIYDNAGIPSFMYKFTRVSNKELFGGSDKPHPAFVIGGEVYDEIYISVYPNCEINGKPYSLPYQKPWTNLTNDEAAEACFSKGEGWHLMTAAEWGVIANISLKNGTLPHGNTNDGQYHADASEKGVKYDGGNGRTLTGSGPATWTHNHTPEGVHDLCGNVWEMLRGLRIKDGVLYAAKDNDAALNIDLTQEGDDWHRIKDNSGNIVKVSVDGSIKITTYPAVEQDYTGDCWEDVDIDCESEQLKELALFAGEPKAYLYIDSTDGEYFPIRGGNWYSGANAGLFSAYLGNPRSNSHWSFGFRSAYFKKH